MDRTTRRRLLKQIAATGAAVVAAAAPPAMAQEKVAPSPTLEGGQVPMAETLAHYAINLKYEDLPQEVVRVFQQRTGTPAGICLTCRFGTEIVNSAGVPIGVDRDPSIQAHWSPISIRCHLSEWGPDSVLKHRKAQLCR
jgi:hypothetical protein